MSRLLQLNQNTQKRHIFSTRSLREVFFEVSWRGRGSHKPKNTKITIKLNRTIIVFHLLQQPVVKNSQLPSPARDNTSYNKACR